MSDRSATPPSGYADVIVTIPSLRPIHNTANRVRVHIWMPTDLQLSSSTNQFSRVSGWQDPTSCDGTDRYQPARISATTSFSSGTESFMGGVLSLVINHVSYVNTRVVKLVSCIILPIQKKLQYKRMASVQRTKWLPLLP